MRSALGIALAAAAVMTAAPGSAEADCRPPAADRVTQTRAALGSKAYGVIRVERTLVGGGPGANRLPMKLTSQLYLGERWELVFVREGLSVRAYTSAPLRHEHYHVEFPPDALWIF